MALAVCGPTFAQDSADAVPATSVPAVAMTSVIVANQVPGFPCFGAAPGCGDTVPNTLGMLFPLAYVSQGTAVTYVLTFQNNSYTGPCTIAYSLTQGSTVIQSGYFNITCGPGLYLYNFTNTIPLTPGATMLHGLLAAGKTKSKASMTFYIE